MYWHWLFVFTRITVNVPRIVINCFGEYCIRVWMALAAMSCLRRQVRWRASMAAAEFSSHVIPTLACAMAWDLWLRPFSCFLLDKKALKNQGRHQGPNAHGNHGWWARRTTPPPCRPGTRAQPGRSLAFPHTAQGQRTAWQQTPPYPLPSWRTRIRHLLSSRDSLLSSLRVIARHEAIYLWQIYGRFKTLSGQKKWKKPLKDRSFYSLSLSPQGYS